MSIWRIAFLATAMIGLVFAILWLAFPPAGP